MASTTKTNLTDDSFLGVLNFMSISEVLKFEATSRRNTKLVKQHFLTRKSLIIDKLPDEEPEKATKATLYVLKRCGGGLEYFQARTRSGALINGLRGMQFKESIKNPSKKFPHLVYFDRDNNLYNFSYWLAHAKGLLVTLQEIKNVHPCLVDEEMRKNSTDIYQEYRNSMKILRLLQDNLAMPDHQEPEEAEAVTSKESSG